MSKAEAGVAYHSRLFGRVTRQFDEFAAGLAADLGHLHRAGREDLSQEWDDACIKRTARSILASLVKDEPLDQGCTGWLTATGARIARLGFSDRSVAAAARSAMTRGMTLVLSHTYEAAAGPIDGVHVASVLGVVVARHIQVEEQVISALLAGHDQQRSLSTDRPRDKATLVDRLVCSRWSDEHEIQADAKACGVDLSVPHGLLLFAGSGPDSDTSVVERASTSFVAGHRSATAGPLRLAPLPHVAVLVPARPQRSWSKALRIASDVALQHGVHGFWYEAVAPLEGLPTQYRRAGADLGLPIAATLPAGVLTESELAFHRVCTAAPVEVRLDLVERTAGPLLEDPFADDLVATLEAFAQSGSPARVASVLALHENTVRDRLVKITRLTSRDVKKPADFEQLMLAVRLRRVRPTERAKSPRRGGG